jgi:hypothetical protein
VGAIGAGGRTGDEIGIDGAIDGDMGTASLYLPRPFWAADRACVRAQRATARPKPRSENRCAALRADPERNAPDVTPQPVAAGPPKRSAPPSTTPHSPSRIPPRGWQTRCWSGARTLHFIGAASCRC